MIASLSADRRSFSLSGIADMGGWSATFPVEDLQKHLEFYRGLRDRQGGRFARFFVRTVDGLEAIERELSRPAAGP